MRVIAIQGSACETQHLGGINGTKLAPRCVVPRRRILRPQTTRKALLSHMPQLLSLGRLSLRKVRHQYRQWQWRPWVPVSEQCLGSWKYRRRHLVGAVMEPGKSSRTRHAKDANRADPCSVPALSWAVLFCLSFALRCFFCLRSFPAGICFLFSWGVFFWFHRGLCFPRRLLLARRVKL